jgi:hypothetical protein
MNVPAVCNGCGNESPAWDKLCIHCSTLVSCQDCHETYKRGQGLQDVDLCPRCLNEAFTEPAKETYPCEGDPRNPHEEFGFDYSWETYNGK